METSGRRLEASTACSPELGRTACQSAQARGSSTSTSSPPSATFRSRNAPRCRATTSCDMARPSPSPPVCRLREGSPRSKGCRRRGTSSTGIPGPRVADADERRVRTHLQGHGRGFAVAQRIVDEVVEHAAQRIRIGIHPHRRGRRRPSDLAAARDRILDARRDQCAHVDAFAGPLRMHAACVVQYLPDHPAHAVDVRHHALPRVRRGRFDADAQAGQRGAQVMGDGDQHAGALRRLRRHAGMHRRHRRRDLADFARPG